MNCFGEKKITDWDTDPLTDSSDFMGPFLPKGKCLGNLTKRLSKLLGKIIWIPFKLLNFWIIKPIHESKLIVV